MEKIRIERTGIKIVRFPVPSAPNRADVACLASWPQDDLSVHLLITRVCSICELVVRDFKRFQTRGTAALMRSGSQDIYGNSGFVKSRCDACYTHLQTYKADKTLSELRNKRLMRSGVRLSAFFPHPLLTTPSQVDIESWLAGQACEICDTTVRSLDFKGAKVLTWS